VIRAILIGVLVILIARAFWRLFDGILEAAGGTGGAGTRTPSAVKLVRDPVCGTWVPKDAAVTLVAHGQTHAFCSEACRDTFTRKAS
jgi:uncharacterized protein